jgi:hypothetical protein
MFLKASFVPEDHIFCKYGFERVAWYICQKEKRVAWYLIYMQIEVTIELLTNLFTLLWLYMDSFLLRIAIWLEREKKAYS